MLHTHIAFLRKFYISGLLAASFLLVFISLAIFPVANSFSGVQAASVLSETTLTMTTSDIALALSVDSATGTFSESDSADFSVITNNYSGYTLSIHAATDDENYSKLVNGSSALNSISAASSESSFNNGNWGYKPSKLNSAANTDFQPAPTYEGTTLDTTAVANNEANTYDISIGAKADYSLPAGKYSNTFVITAIANPVGYAISYSDNTGDPSVAGIPSAQVGDTTTTSVELSSNVPTRTGYVFGDWCDGTVTNTLGVDSCTGNVYSPGDTYDMNQTGPNVLELKAMWARKYTISFDANTGTGTMPDQVITGSYSLLDENLFTKDGYDFDGWNTEADGNGTGYTDMDDFNVPATGTGTTLYAQWALSAVTFDQAFAAAGKTKDATSDKYKMQDINTAAICEAVDVGQETELVDTRDNIVYHVGKLVDGRCWLLDNLALDLTNSTVLNNLSADNTNADATALGYLKGTTTRNPSTDPDGNYATAGVTNWTSSYSYSAPLVNMASKDITRADLINPSDTMTEADDWKFGGYYNYCAASAGSYCYGNGTSQGSPSGNATADICPSGWRMPTGGASGEYQLLTNAITGGDSDDIATEPEISNIRKALRLPLPGIIDRGSALSQGSRGFFWSSMYNNSFDMYILAVSTSVVYPQFMVNRDIGDSVRCIAQNHAYMQDYDKTSLANILPETGDTVTLYDKRDETPYTVGKLADGNYWMLDNLALDLTDTNVKVKLSSTNTNASDAALDYLRGTTTRDPSMDPNGGFATAGITTWASSAYSFSAPLVDATYKNVDAEDGSGKKGVIYNYCAVSAGSYCYGDGSLSGTAYDKPNTDIDAEYDVCPSSWRLPTGGNPVDSSTEADGAEYRKLFDIYNAFDNPTDYDNALRPTKGGYIAYGSYSANTYGYWSSTFSYGANVFVDQHGTIVNSNRSYGYPIRCIAK